MTIFAILSMLAGTVIMISASAFCLNYKLAQDASIKALPIQGNNKKNCAVYDDGELPTWNDPLWQQEGLSSQNELILSFTRTNHKIEKQLPLIGLLDKSFYHIH